MIVPSDTGTDYLQFKCTECGNVFDHAMEITSDSPLTGKAKYDIRYWDRFKIYLQCDQCGAEGEKKMSLRPDLAKKKSS